jgi:alpha-L-fucosidase
MNLATGCVFLLSLLSMAAPAAEPLARNEPPTTRASSLAPEAKGPAPLKADTAGGNSKGYDMAPETRLEVVEAAVSALTNRLPDGPFKPTWDSLRQNYRVPRWFTEAKFGLFIHWGLYAVPAHHNEWYEKHMYATESQWHRDHFGPQDQFGYKDFIPLFKAEKFDPEAWAELFKESGARYVIPAAQHHDNFALWDSQVAPYNAARMGPRRDLIGELAKAIRSRGLKVGVSNHGMENFQFINPSPVLAADLKARNADLYDPAWAGFYNVADRSDAACQRFLMDWFQRNVELIDKYQPDVLWFDNGIDIRYLDSLKLRVAAYYYNRATEWGKEVTLCAKKAAFAPSNRNTETIGSTMDFEKVGARSPADIRTGTWMVDHPIGSTWGYTSNMTVSGPAAIIRLLVETVSKNGNFTLNLSPRADGDIPETQQNTLREIGRWLKLNGEAIYGTHNWIQYSDTAEPPLTPPSEHTLYFTVKSNALYVLIVGSWPQPTITIPSLAPGKTLGGKVAKVELLGHPNALHFSESDQGLRIELPTAPPGHYAWALRLTGLKTNPATTTQSGNPKI